MVIADEEEWLQVLVASERMGQLIDCLSDPFERSK